MPFLMTTGSVLPSSPLAGQSRLAAAEIAILVSDVDDDDKTRVLDFLAAGRLEFLTRRFVVGGCYRRSLEAIARREKPIANQPVDRA